MTPEQRAVWQKAMEPQFAKIVADVQSEDLRGPYDFAFSRFGTMFFMSPGAALRNIRKSLKPGGVLWICWPKRSSGEPDAVRSTPDQ